ncbi:MAG: DUF3418 domain-containing protein, partial [Deltaproteobacteria bacterium]
RFLERNRELAARLEDMEDRVRQRDILVDDQTLFQFYEERLPAEVCDQAGLNRLLRRRQGDDFLTMREEDILCRAPAAEQLDQFPEEISSGEFSLPLAYKFQPGTEEDGVSVTLPMSLLSRIAPEAFEWLVPGLLHEKISFLLKGLPKSLRKQLIPISQTAEALLQELNPDRGSLYGQLERLIAERYGVEVARSHWPIEELPPHLRMRFCLTDHQGRVLTASREFDELAPVQPPPAWGDQLTSLRKKWEREGITTWDFAGLPERIAIEGNSGQFYGFAYPGLTTEGPSSAALRLFADEAESRGATREGVLVLYRNAFPRHFKDAKKDFALPRSDWALYEGLAGHEEFNRQLLAAILHHIFETGEGRLPVKERFEQKIAEIRAEGIYARGMALLKAVRNVLEERRTVLGHICRFEEMAAPGRADRFAEYRSQVARILPPEFLEQLDLEQLGAAARYLKALRIRVERAHSAPAKDDAKAAQIAPHETRLAGASPRNGAAPERGRLLAEYRQMVEEFKISLFAPEMKTAFPVSAKRLEQKWKEVERVL